MKEGRDMSLKGILVHADTGPGTESRVRLAARVAHDHQARLIGAAARLPMPLLEVYAGGAAMISAGLMDAADEAAETAFKTAEADFGKWIAGLGLTAEWRSAVDFPAVAIAAMATAVDLVVIGPTNGDQPVDAGDVIMKAGRPVLVVPADGDRLNGETVLVAWKNTSEARRALSDASPFLKAAKSVTLVHVGEGGGGDTAVDDALLFLRSHGITATAQVLDPGSLTPADEILNVARRTGAGLIVLGAYGHSRLREWVFGGVTRHLLGRCDIPCLFSH
jgi:nucleotide-binding universal stress UspA family protein